MNGMPLFGYTTTILILREELTRFTLEQDSRSNSLNNLWQQLR